PISDWRALLRHTILRFRFHHLPTRSCYPPNSVTRTTKSALPIGTQVVILASSAEEPLPCAAGSVGVVVAHCGGDKDCYDVRTTDGFIVALPRASLGIRKHFQLETALHSRIQDTPDLRQFIIYRCVVGSRAFGLDVESSDFDRRGVFLPPAELQWS